MNTKQQALLAASVAGLITMVGVVSGNQVQAAESEQVHCYGINKCKGTGSCGGAGNACAGKNACAGQGFINLEKETCLKIKDGSLTPVSG